MSEEQTKRLPDKAFKRVEKELYRYPRYKATLAAYPTNRGDVLQRFREWPPPEGHVDGLISDRTGGAAIRLNHLDERRVWASMMVGIIDACFQSLGDEEQELVRLKYFERNDYTNEQVIATMQMTRPISRAQWYRMRVAVVEEFADAMHHIEWVRDAS